jgi:hypothetical protein
MQARRAQARTPLIIISSAADTRRLSRCPSVPRDKVRTDREQKCSGMHFKSPQRPGEMGCKHGAGLVVGSQHEGHLEVEELVPDLPHQPYGMNSASVSEPASRSVEAKELAHGVTVTGTATRQPHVCRVEVPCPLGSLQIELCR